MIDTIVFERDVACSCPEHHGQNDVFQDEKDILVGMRELYHGCQPLDHITQHLQRLKENYLFEELDLSSERSLKHARARTAQTTLVRKHNGYGKCGQTCVGDGNQCVNLILRFTIHVGISHSQSNRH